MNRDFPWSKKGGVPADVVEGKEVSADAER